MSRLAGARIAVAGAGAMGLATALELLRRGAAVLLADPALLGDNASGVAAGMLAPAMEAVADIASAGHYALLRDARDAWIRFAEGLAPIDRSGALWTGDEAGLAGRLARLHALGAAAEVLAPAAARSLSPGLDAGSAVFTPEDWRLEPTAMLAAMHAAFRREGGQTVQAAIAAAAPGHVTLSNGRTWAVDHAVIAVGHPSNLSIRLAPELARLSPIKGQILRFEAGAAPAGGPVIRAADVYLAPGCAGPAAGATMEPGVCDRRVEPATVERLRAAAARLFPPLAHAPVQAMAAVRTATADGLPLVGPSLAPGVLLAAGARRNGWLLAALAADIIAAHVEGETAGPWALALDPRRFDGAGAASPGFSRH